MNVPPQEPKSIPPASKPRTPAGTIGALAGAVIAGLYLINPTFGVLEFIPDNTPLLGNMDEVAATTLLLSCLSYLGINLPFLRRR